MSLTTGNATPAVKSSTKNNCSAAESLMILRYHVIMLFLSPAWLASGFMWRPYNAFNEIPGIGTMCSFPLGTSGNRSRFLSDGGILGTTVLIHFGKQGRPGVYRSGSVHRLSEVWVPGSRRWVLPAAWRWERFFQSACNGWGKPAKICLQPLRWPTWGYPLSALQSIFWSVAAARSTKLPVMALAAGAGILSPCPAACASLVEGA